MKIKYIYISLFPLFILLVFPELTLQTSLAAEKTSCHTIYLCKSFLGLGVSDWIIVAMAIFLIMHAVLYGTIFLDKTSTFYKVTVVSIVYLIIGLLYNSFVYFDLTAYLYDFKLFLYFVVTYYWLKIFCKFECSIMHLFLIFFIIAIGNFYDFVYIQNFGKSEFPQLLSFMPSILPLININFLILFFIYLKKYKLFILLLIFFELFSLINHASLSSLYQLLAFLAFVVLYQFKFKQITLIIFIFISWLILYFALPLIILEILPLITDLKSDGLEIRKTKTLNALYNYFINIPVFIGKGLGATYFEFFESGYSNIYSTGANHVEGNVKFILHTPLAIFYKFGIIGVFIMMFILIKTSVNLLKKTEVANDSVVKFISICYPTFIISVLITPGILTNSILAAIFIFISDQKLQKVKNNKT